jgi:deoxyribodipyrimidine photo-lyase
MSTVIHWFRRDLRLTDNRALHAALMSGMPVIPVFIFDEQIYKSERSSTRRLLFLLKALHSLDKELRQHHSHLLIRFGNPPSALRELVSEVNAQGVYFNKDYSPAALKRDAEVKQTLTVAIHEYDDLLLIAPSQVLKDNANPYTIFTPFKKRWLTIEKAPFEPHFPNGKFHHLEGIDGKTIPPPQELGCSTALEVPDAGEQAGQSRLNSFLSGSIYQYATERNRLAFDPLSDSSNATSFLSPHLHLGLLSIRQTYWQARMAYQNAPDKASAASVETWVSELIWREFYNHILFHFPQVTKNNFRSEYDSVQWQYAPEELQAWQSGQTGYPIVDAAMRQLNATGWMPNRARMIVASFLCKDLLIDWREGERYFMQQLIDGDTAANNGGWQWTAGTGTDAQPYFRVFNPVSQSRKFDPDGMYIRRWLPELRDVNDKFIHAPFESPTPPLNYPMPIVEHNFARQRTLQAFRIK